MIERLQRLPFFLIFIVYAMYLGYQLYEFHFDNAGELEAHKVRVASLQTDVQVLKKKLTEGKKFLDSLDLKKQDIQAQVRKLEEFQGSLSENLDVPSMFKMLVIEAKRTGLRVDSIDPGKRTLKEFYLEQEFRLNVHGSYYQILQFFQRVSQLQRILRVESFTLHPQSNTSTLKNTTLDSQLSIRSYQYVVGKEDNIGKGAIAK